ncbi:MAG: redoxin domain-containing protein [Legionellales bacterium]|nr:redoxin domain-containing protein [Legionellales bacterium]
MALTPSNMLALGTPAPDFTLPDTISQTDVSLANIKSDIATVVMFICNHCPYVKHLQQALVDIANTYQAKGIAFVAISANDVENYPDDAPDKMRDIAKHYHYPFPYLYDETQAVAKAYKAACTPDFFIFDQTLQCVYRGQFDDSRPGNDTLVTGRDLRQALDHLLVGEPVSSEQRPSVGCNIKWKQ